jgi:hypothetical protein
MIQSGFDDYRYKVRKEKRDRIKRLNREIKKRQIEIKKLRKELKS